MRAGMGQRCEGNASCIPICPANAKYTALRTFRELEDLAQNNQFLDLEVQSQAVVSNLNVDEKSGRVNSLDFLFYPHSELPARNQHTIEADTFVLAASAIENAKILLISGQPGTGLANSSGQVGCNLMDHPFVLHWGLLKDKEVELGTFRGPGITSDLPVRTGPWRKNHAAFRTDVSNWGWGLAAGAPHKDLYRLTDPQGFASQYTGYNTKHIPSVPLYGKKLRAKLRYDVQRQVSLGYLFEQPPCKRNRVTVDPQLKDRLGIPRPILDYKIDPYVIRGMECAKALTKEVFDKAGIQDFTNFEHAIGGPISSDTEGRFKYIGAGHIMGTHRMGSDMQESVVNSYQKSWDHENLFIIGAGSFPTAGTANPTLTIAALSLRSADHYILKRRS
jgi:choline dehydrogenase-like flavoprotein